MVLFTPLLTFVVENEMMMGVKKLLFLIVVQTFVTLSVFAQQTSAPCPCCEEEYQQFDFWLGDWVVYSQGKMAGFNKVTKIEDGCIIRENWKSVGSNYTGTSYNFYDKAAKKWKQTWIDNQGSVLELAGNLSGNKMILKSQELIDSEGRRIINRVTWTKNPDETVNQVWEASEDGGITFKLIFDGLYRKRKLP
jgi:hypothetical protein